VPEVNVPESLNIKADYDKIERVLVNYLTNAINHVYRNGIIKITACKFGEKAKISVFNTGVYIPEQSIDKIWDSFYKVDKARTREYGGTGLGLSIVRALLDLHGFNYGAVNTDNGVEFWFDADISEGIIQ
jgi:signal transduction histidine kinase